MTEARPSNSANPLAEPLRLPCGVVLPNRLMKSAMTEGLADPLGRVTDRLVQLYRTWGQGGCGVLVTGNVMIDRRYLERPGNVVVDGNGGDEMLAGLARAGTAGGSQLWMQISHPGRQCARVSNNQPVAPSAVGLRLMGNFARPRAMTLEEIAHAIEGYARVAGHAQKAGFTGVQVHGAHGYLISQFLSPVVNRRDDEWGGPIENRARFLLETVRAVRERVGSDFPVSVKLNSADFQKGGFSLADCQQVACWLDEEKLDLLEISGGTYEQLRLIGYRGREDQAEDPPRKSTRQREAYFLDYAKSLREAVAMPMAVTGGFRSRAAMAEALMANELDVVGLARPLCTDPDIAARLVAARAEVTPAHEHRLRLGNGILGPNSRINTIKALNAQAAVAWYYRQIIQLAKGEPALEDLSAFGALWRHFRDEYRIGLKRRWRMRGRQREPGRRT